MREKVDKNEAPSGYYAIPKPQVIHGITPNLCTFCDWRKECQKPDTDFKDHNHMCMPYTKVTGDGLEFKRNDGCSVVFKRVKKQGYLF